MDDWPFDQAPDVAAITSAAVLDGSPILLVVHYSEDDSWAFLEGDHFEATDGRVIGMKTAIGIDPTLAGIADLSPGWVARRDFVGGSWTREADPSV
ncbi:MAG: hypothetical protein AB7O37_13775 [Vicinamibacteria bacterium]